MRVKLLEWADWSSPGTIDPSEGCRPREDPGWVDIDVTNPRMLEMIERDGGLYVPFPALLSPEHFSNERATPETKAKLKAATRPDETGERHRVPPSPRERPADEPGSRYPGDMGSRSQRQRAAAGLGGRRLHIPGTRGGTPPGRDRPKPDVSPTQPLPPVTATPRQTR